MNININDMSYKQLADILVKLGINNITEKMLDELENCWNQFPIEVLNSMNKMALLLTSVGCGKYNLNTGKWMPSSNKVYSFDLEALDIEGMYILLLSRIATISNNELEFSNINEHTSDINYQQGTGTKLITFVLNGKKYIFEAKCNYDWYDIEILDYINQILKEENNSKQLYFMNDGYQECIIFYCTEDWSRLFENKTGCKLLNKTM